VKKALLSTLILFLVLLHVSAQEVVNQQAIIGFYNIENLFDTDDDKETYMDDEFLPPKWTKERYAIKQANMAKVIAAMQVDLLGLAEIENRKVLEDLVTHPNLAARRFQIIHFDRLGIDVALLYRPSVFKPFHTQTIPIVDPKDAKFKTRDILWVKGLCMGDTLNVVVNHWPSRRGGKEDKRLLAAATLRKAVDSVLAINPASNIIIMGDLNDDPNNKSLKKILLASGDESKKNTLYNTAEPTFKKGYGTLAFNGVWNMFDQIIVSSSLMDGQSIDYVQDSFMVFAAKWMQETTGKYSGMPKRTFRGAHFNDDGYSDHFPVYIVLKKFSNP
jgi:predicted extracellular nuclease